MLDEKELIELATLKFEQLKKQSSDKKNTVEFTEVYKESIEQRDRIRIHAESGVFPEKLFFERAPNQTEVEYNYLKGNYKTVTMPVWERFQSVLSRIWGDQNWKIDYKGNDPAKQYLEEDYPTYGSLEAYFKDVITTNKELDNNGVIALMIKDLPWREDDETPVSDREELKPIVYYYECDKVIGFEDGEYAIVITNENSPVLFGGRTVNEGIVIDIYDNENIYRSYQVGKKTDYEFETILYYPHSLGVLPVKKLNGKAQQREEEVFYQSAFISAVDNLDKALLDESYLSAVKAKCAYPRGWEYVSECDYQSDEGNKCINGLILIDGVDKRCPECAGTGKKRPGILGVHQIKVSEYGGDGAKIPSPPFGWEAPDVAILELLNTHVDKYMNKAATILNIDISNSDVKGGDTALGKQIDREEQFAFIKKISDQIFELFDFSNKIICQVRFGKETVVPEITFPRTFALRNDADLTQEIANANTADLPDLAIKKLMLEYFQTRFGTDPEGQKKIDLIFSVDRLIGLSNDDILKKKASGTVAGWEDVLHTSIEMFIEDLIDENPSFLDLDKRAQKEQIVNAAKMRFTEIAPAKVNVDDVLANANA